MIFVVTPLAVTIEIVQRVVDDFALICQKSANCKCARRATDNELRALTEYLAAISELEELHELNHDRCSSWIHQRIWHVRHISAIVKLQLSFLAPSKISIAVHCTLYMYYLFSVLLSLSLEDYHDIDGDGIDRDGNRN